MSSDIDQQAKETSSSTSPSQVSSPLHIRNTPTSSRYNPVSPATPKTPQSFVKGSPQTPQSSRSRHCWVFHAYKLGDSFSMDITVRTHTGKVGPLSLAKAAAKYKPSFGSVVWFEVDKVKDKTGKYVTAVVVTNEDNLKHPLRQDLLFMFLKSTDSFTQLCQGLITDNKMSLLLKYLNCCVSSEGFTMFKAEKFSKDGVDLERAGIVSDGLKREGGSMTELQEFISLAKEHAIIIGANDGRDKVIKQKRIQDYYLSDVPVKKMNKSETVEHNFQTECKDKEGLEQKLVSTFSGFQSISLDNLSVSENLCLPINEAEVNALAESMSARFNPALSVLTVAGDDDKFSDQKQYSVLEGVHRYKALKLLDAQKKFEQLPGVKDRKVQCFILTSTGDPAIDNYCNIRSNDQARQFHTDPDAGINQLIYVFVFLFKHYADPNKAVEAMERIAKLKHLRAEDLTSLRKISSWPLDILEHLIIVLKKFERFQTTG